MKHQYFGDVNDYVKYGLLRALSGGSGLRVGVVWMLTPDDDRPDGSRTAYWKDEAWRTHDPQLFDRLAKLATRPAARDLELFRRWDLVPGAVDFDALLPDTADARVAWMVAVREALEDCPLLFFDPDNGFEIESVPFGRRGSNRYLYWAEATTAWDAGHSLLVYQHFPRENRDDFAARLHERAAARLPGARITSFRSDHVLFLLASRPEHAESLATATEIAGARWAGRVVVTGPAPQENRQQQGPGDRAADLAAVCDALLHRGPTVAAATLAGRWPFAAPATTRRAHTELEALRVWLRDGFVDRYDGARLVFPGALRLLSELLPAEFPYHPNWKVGETHPAYWDLCPVLDHVVPVSRGGADGDANWVTTSQRNNSAKAQFTLEELGWTLKPAGTMADWDGLTGWFRSMLAERPALREHDAIGHWSRLLDRVLPGR